MTVGASQQSLSAAVARLEAQLSCRLLERAGRRVEPTAAGRALLARAPAVFAAMDEATAAMRAADGVVSGSLGLRYGLDSEAFVEPLLAAFQDRHPALAVQAWNRHGCGQPRRAAGRGRGRGLAWAAAPADLETLVVVEEQALLALPERHPLAGHATVRPAAVAGVSGQAATAEAVLRGDGLCPVSATLAARILRPGLVLRPLDPPLRIPLLLAWRGPLRGPLRALVADLPGGP